MWSCDNHSAPQVPPFQCSKEETIGFMLGVLPTLGELDRVVEIGLICLHHLKHWKLSKSALIPMIKWNTLGNLSMVRWKKCIIDLENWYHPTAYIHHSFQFSVLMSSASRIACFSHEASKVQPVMLFVTVSLSFLRANSSKGIFNN